MFLQNAHSGENKWWQYLITLALVVGGSLLGQVPLLLLYILKGSQSNLSEEEMATMIESLDFSAIGIGQNISLLLV